MTPTFQPTLVPTPNPSEQMMAPDPVQGSSGNAGLTGQTDPAQAGMCAANLMLCKSTMAGMEMDMPCCAGMGLQCVEIGNGLSQCMMPNSELGANGSSDDDGFDFSKNGVVIT